MKHRFIVWLLCAAWVMPAVAAEKPVIVVSTSLLETAVRDLLGSESEVIRLMPPGSCPGHFDLTPAQVRAMTSAGLFVRHDYQTTLDDGILKSGFGHDRIHAATSHESFVIPAAYEALCRELADRFIAEWPMHADRIRARQQAVHEQAEKVNEEARHQLERIGNRRVLAASYQRAFCEWAGLDVVAVFHAGADGSAWLLSRAVDMARTAGAEAVVGNQQWGTRHLAALSEATRLPGIMLSNFPDRGGEGAYWDFFRDNINALLSGLP